MSLQRALDVLRDSGTPDVADMVLGSSSWNEIVSRSDYAEAIQDRELVTR